MFKNILITATIYSLVSGSLFPGEASAMLPVGNDADRHFYKDQEWIWNLQEQQSSSAKEAESRELTFTPPTHPPQVELAFTPPTHPPQVELAFTPPTHPPQEEMAFPPPTHPPQGKLGFT